MAKEEKRQRENKERQKSSQGIKRYFERMKQERQTRKRKKARQQAEESYEEELNQEGRTSKSRKKEHSSYHKWGRRLTAANVIVFILLIIAIWMVFYI